MMRIAIIEDEKFTAKDLANTLKAVDPEVEIVGMLHSVEEGIAYFRNKPQLNLIFSDIELGDGLSFEIFQTTENSIPIVFCTAYQQYTLEAFNTVGIDYILKPFNKESIEKTLRKYKTLANSFGPPVQDLTFLLSALKQHINPKSQSIIVSQKDRIIPIHGEQIALFFIENEITYAYTFDQKKLATAYKMEILEKTFSPLFFRANRQFLINRKAVKDATHHFNRKLLANLTIPFPEPIVVGKLRATAFVSWLMEV